MTSSLTTDYAKNYCNRTLIVKVIVENVVTCFFWDTVYNQFINDGCHDSSTFVLFIPYIIALTKTWDGI